MTLCFSNYYLSAVAQRLSMVWFTSQEVGHWKQLETPPTSQFTKWIQLIRKKDLVFSKSFLVNQPKSTGFL